MEESILDDILAKEVIRRMRRKKLIYCSLNLLIQVLLLYMIHRRLLVDNLPHFLIWLGLAAPNLINFYNLVLYYKALQRLSRFKLK